MNWLSLKRQRLRFAVLVATNLEGPDVVEVAALLCIVEVAVSSALAVK